MFIHTLKQALKQADVDLTDHRIDLISRLVCALVQVRSVNLKKLACSLSGAAQIESLWIQLLSAPFGLCDTTKVNWYISFVYPHAPRRGAYEGVYSVDPPPKI